MKKFIISFLSMALCGAILFAMVYGILLYTMPTYKSEVGNENYTEKITGTYLVSQSAKQDDLIIFGSSELRTLEISTHPANFFAGERSGFQVNLVGRGSCQSLIHAISIASLGDELRGKKVVLITSPQSYVEEGIAPDMFMANFSPQQYFTLLEDPEISDKAKQYISERILTLYGRYELMPNAGKPDVDVRWIAEYYANPTMLTSAREMVMGPYYDFDKKLLTAKDMVRSRNLIKSVEENETQVKSSDIDWNVEEEEAVSQGKEMTGNNEFGMLDEYYTTYIGTRLARQKGSEDTLSYSVSEEYNDLRLLFEICKQKGTEPLFVHVPLNGQWSDYTGFTADRREEYYKNVRDIVNEYDIEMLDLTGYEYEEYFMCDVMHLGWKGWLEVDKGLIEYYYTD